MSSALTETVAVERPRSVLICHAGSRENLEGIAPWLASFTDLVGLVILHEKGTRLQSRIRNEIGRIGRLRFLDVIAFRLYYAAFLAREDSRWLDRALGSLAARYGKIPSSVEVLTVADPNGPEVEQFLTRLQPDLMIARCKRILKERIFTIPRIGTFVLHPGICPEYRNAHGAFWALAKRDLENVGLTLLKIDRGVDTGPVYGYFSYNFDEVRESHIVIMTRVVLDNLDAIGRKLMDICRGAAVPIDTTGRRSAVWGQPWLSSYLRWKWAARRTNERCIP
jgi:hypothetical protein